MSLRKLLAQILYQVLSGWTANPRQLLYTVLYCSCDELCLNEAPLRRPFLKILYENDAIKKNNLDAETLKTS